MKASAFLLLAVGCLSVSVRAEEALAAPQKVQLENVPPRLMAWWLDPAHNEGPAPLESADEFLTRPLIPNGYAVGHASVVPGKVPFALPAGVEKIVALDEQNALLVYGTPEGVGEVQEKIGSLDQPLHSVQFEARLLQIAPGETSEFEPGLNLQEGVASSSFLSSKYEAALAKMIEQGKAKFLSKMSATASNNSPVRLTFEGPSGKRPKLMINVTPSLNNDEFSRVLVSWYDSTNSRVGKTAAEERPASQVLFPVQDGTTIAIKGFNNGLILSREEAADSKVILLLTPHILRDVKQGTQ